MSFSMQTYSHSYGYVKLSSTGSMPFTDVHAIKDWLEDLYISLIPDLT